MADATPLQEQGPQVVGQFGKSTDYDLSNLTGFNTMFQPMLTLYLLTTELHR